jgi:FAD/FMN-containing dehydrogenase
MLRRRFLTFLSGFAVAARVGLRPAQAAHASATGDATYAWPSDEQWQQLNTQTGGRLAPVTVPQLSSAEAAQLLSNPLYLGDQPGLTQSSGWIDAWRSTPSAYVVRASSVGDVVAAVRFAKQHHVRLVVKGGGHSYLGGSNAHDSLLIWTRDLREIVVHDAFVTAGSATAPVPAVSVGAGCIWQHVYRAVTGDAGRYVQGGGCTTVGVAGLVQGGGFGNFSKRFGLAAASLLEAQIVTADGEVRVVNAARDPDLFWALKGGGGGTFGVVTRLTLKTHELPSTFGAVFWKVSARTDTAFRSLLAKFVQIYARALFNPHWGEQVQLYRANQMRVQMLFEGLDEAAARKSWDELRAFVAAHPEDYEELQPLLVVTMPARHMWDPDFLSKQPGVITRDQRPDAQAGDFWWTGNTEEAGTFWHGYDSLWLPQQLLQPARQSALVDAWFAASRHWSVTLHFNKGLAGAAQDALETSRQTAMNPEVLDAFALAIIGMDGPSAYAPLPPPDLTAARENRAHIRAAGQALRRVAPSAGSYLSECDYFLQHWQTACWGEHRKRLAQIKQRYDPDGVFMVHHGVGSEGLAQRRFAVPHTAPHHAERPPTAK